MLERHHSCNLSRREGSPSGSEETVDEPLPLRVTKAVVEEAGRDTRLPFVTERTC
jgi:hypothetical protein